MATKNMKIDPKKGTIKKITKRMKWKKKIQSNFSSNK